MNREREFLGEALHQLAQPLTALRLSVEQGLSSAQDAQGSRQIMEDCLQLIDRLMHDLAIFREIASLEVAPPLQSHEGRELLHSCVEEMTPVAGNCGIAIHLTAEPTNIDCNEALFQRATFILLDEMIATAPPGSTISIALCRSGNGVALDMRPGTLGGQRQALCRKLMQFAGAINTEFLAERTSLLFKEHSNRPFAGISLADKRILISR